MNWLLGKDRYNPLIRPAVNRTERVPVKLQVSLAQLISVVRHQILVPHCIVAGVFAHVGEKLCCGDIKRKRGWETEDDGKDRAKATKL